MNRYTPEILYQHADYYIWGACDVNVDLISSIHSVTVYLSVLSPLKITATLSDFTVTLICVLLLGVLTLSHGRVAWLCEEVLLCSTLPIIG